MRSVAAAAAVVMVALTMLIGSVPAAAAPGGLRLVLSDMNPRVVTGDGPDTLVVGGTLVNDGPDPVTDIQVRVQRGNPLTTDGQLRDALDGDAPTDSAACPFEKVADELAPGGQVSVRPTVPLVVPASRSAPPGRTSCSSTSTAPPQAAHGPGWPPPHAAAGRRPAGYDACAGPRRPGAAHRALPDRGHAPPDRHRAGIPAAARRRLPRRFVRPDRTPRRARRCARPARACGLHRGPGSAWPLTPTSSRPRP